MSKTAMSARALLDSRVTNDEGVTLGRVDDLVIERSSGSIAYAVLDVEPAGEAAGARPHTDGRTLAIAWTAFRFPDSGALPVLDVRREVLLRSARRR